MSTDRVKSRGTVGHQAGWRRKRRVPLTRWEIPVLVTTLQKAHGITGVLYRAD